MDRLLSRVLLLLAALVALPAAAADANWWQAEWKYRKPITVDAGPQGAGLAGDPGRTPLLLRLHTGNFGFDGTQDAGNDLRFVSGDGRTVLAHQIEQFDPTLGLALVWVDLPAVSAAAPQTIWMYYGNEKAPASGNGQQVFDPDYTLVYHFAEANAPARDTTAYGNNAGAVVPPSEGAVIGRGVQLGAGPLPALATAPVVGADAPGAAQPLANFEGALDELRISRVARPAALLLADATAQGADSRLVSYGADEQSAGQSHFAFILKAMPFDAWVVVAILGLMMLLSWAIMIAKSRHFGRTSKANAVFTESFGKLSGVPLRTLSDMDRQGKAPTAMHDGSLWRIYQVAIDEMQQRHQRDVNSGYLSGATIAAIRASMDAVMVREQEAMARRMNWLSTTIEGAPYVGLFGTVIGIMLVFVVAAMAGAVDINSVAPGMAAALLCTAAGLGVAIPALFGYNYLGARAEAIGADMAVFIDEFAARLAEEQDGRGPAAVQG